MTLMTSKLLSVSFIAVAMAVILSACSVTDNRNLRGGAAEDALTSVVNNSVEKFNSEGGTETLSIGATEYVVIYDPNAPEGNRVVTANLADESVPTFDDEASISIRALQSLLGSETLTDADFRLSDNVFTIEGEDFSIEVRTANDLVTTSIISGQKTGSAVPQIVVTTYGLSEEALKLFATAVEPSAE
jgi:hypothetical protein